MTGSTNALKETFRKDYRPVDWTTKTVNLNFDIHDGITTVQAKLHLSRNTTASTSAAIYPPLVLDRGSDVTLKSLKLNGIELTPSDYTLDEKNLTIPISKEVGESGALDIEIITTCVPEENTILEGLYKSGGNYATQVRNELRQI